MKNTKFRFTFFAVTLLFAATLITSCGKTDVSDKDEIGKFSLTVDGTKYEGTKVFNGAAIGVRTISAKTTGFEIGILFDETKFIAGTEIDLATLSYISIDNKTSIGKSGKIKIVSTSKVEIKNAVFTGVDANGAAVNHTVNGYISSK
jgi:hypothetical protein